MTAPHVPEPPRHPHPTGHAVRVFGGALGMVLIVAGISIGVAQVGSGGCPRCHMIAIGGACAVIAGLLLVRSAWRAMRTGQGGGRP